MSGIVDALRQFEPDDIETWIFQTALNETGTAFAQLLTAEDTKAPDLVPYLAGPGKWMRSQLPLIYANIKESVDTAPLACRPYLKTATIRERKRYDVYLACLKDAMGVMRSVQRPYCVVKGVAAANTAYANPTLRHCHDLDVVVHSKDRPAFVEALKQADFKLIQDASFDGLSVRLDHPTGLPVNLHCQPVQGDPRFGPEWLIDTAVMIETEAGLMPVPSQSRRILHAWLQRFGHDRFERQVWVPDTVLDLRQCTQADLDALKSDILTHECLPEAQSAVRYLSENFDNLSGLDHLHIPLASQKVAITGPQRARFWVRAKKQQVTQGFTSQLDPMMRLSFAYDRLMPPAIVFQNEPQRPLWRHRARRLAYVVRYGLRRRIMQ